MRRSHRAIWRRAHDEIVATTSSDENVHRLTGGAAEVWRELVVPERPERLVELLADRYGVARADLQAQVAACVDELLALGLVEEVAGADV